MYGLITKFTAKPTKRGALGDAILKGVRNLPGCLSYAVAKDATDPDALWITEVWRDEASHRASLQLPRVRAALGVAADLIDSVGDRIVTKPVGGQGLTT